MLITAMMGVAMSIVFQLAHCVGEAEFPIPDPETVRLEDSWAVHQVATTVNFARDSRPLSWWLGGLNFQIEHHLFPQICHVHYPALSKIVESTCHEYGIKYSIRRAEQIVALAGDKPVVDGVGLKLVMEPAQVQTLAEEGILFEAEEF